MALYVILGVTFLGIFHTSNCQTVSLEAPQNVIIGSNMTITCTFTDAVGNPNTVINVQWSYTGATAFTVRTPGCSLFGTLPSVYSDMAITPSCRTHEYSLVFASVEQTTVDKTWCCNAALNPGPSPSDESCDSPRILTPPLTTPTSDANVPLIVDANCGDPTKATNGQATFTTTTYQSTATYSCDSGYTIDGNATTTCQADGTWSGSVPTCTVSQAGCTVGVVLGIIYGTSWIFAVGVFLVIYKIDQMRLPWKLCDGHLKKWWIWILLFIFVPYVPSAKAIYLFKTKRPAKQPPKATELHSIRTEPPSQTSTFIRRRQRNKSKCV